jgi:lysophospholipase L1-like esterase
VNQRYNEDTWVDLGVFPLQAGARVVLTNETYSDADDPLYEGREIDIAWDAISFQSVPNKPDTAYVALGDSYASGEGIQPYIPNSNVGGDTRPWNNACHRAENGWPRLVMDMFQFRRGGVTTFNFGACSGSTTNQIIAHTHVADIDPVHGWGEVPQIAQGYLDENTTHVSVSIGGNDVGFAQILQTCITPGTSCVDQYQAGMPDRIEAVRDRILDVLDAIRHRAPNAQIVLVGYPYVVMPSGSTRSFDLVCDRFAADERSWFQATQNLIDFWWTWAAGQRGAGYLSLIDDFAGHEACVPNIDDEWINAGVLPGDPGSGPEIPVGRGSFHPKERGASAYANALEAHWGLSGGSK